jgi:large subunit ribosomal protein L6
MSRVGLSPIPVPSGVDVNVDGRDVTVKGPKGELSHEVPETISVRLDDGQILIERTDDERENRSLHGLTRALVNNMVVGVTEGFRKDLEIVGVGYRATPKGNNALELALGFSHPVVVVATRTFTATGVSDGGTVVGYLEGEDVGRGRRVPEAMLWTLDEPARPLGDLPGGTLESAATAISRDGRWIAGRASSADGHEVVLWDEHRRLHRLKEILGVAGDGAAADWRLHSSQGIVQNGDVLTICGNGTNPAGDPEAWIARVRVGILASAPDVR